MRRAPVVAFATGVALLAIAGCANDKGLGDAKSHYPTHCGVAQTAVDGTWYFPTGIYDNGKLVYTNDYSGTGSIAGPVPWSDDEGSSDSLMTFGTFVAGADGTAEFFVKGGRYSIRLSDDKADAAWWIEGCA